MDSSTQLAALVLLLGELSLALAAGCVLLGWLLLRQRRRLQAGHRVVLQRQAQGNDYRAFLQGQLAKVHQAPGQASDARRLLVAYLQGELDALASADGEPDSSWGLRRRHAEQVIAGLQQLDAVKPAPGNGGAADPAQDEGRVRRLEAYRDRFHRLHGHALEESAASRELRAGLQDELAESARARELLARYEGRRRGLDQFLEAPDIGPLARRHTPAAGVSDPRGRLRRTRVLLDGTQRQIDRQRQRHRSLLQQQEILIRELRRSLEAAASEGDAQRERHLRQVKALEEKVQQAELCARTVEKESARRQRVIRDLVGRLERAQEGASQVPGLEDTIDRFCEQAVELQGRIRLLEQRLAEADAEILKSRATEPQVVSGTGS